MKFTDAACISYQKASSLYKCIRNERAEKQSITFSRLLGHFVFGFFIIYIEYALALANYGQRAAVLPLSATHTHVERLQIYTHFNSSIYFARVNCIRSVFSDTRTMWVDELQRKYIPPRFDAKIHPAG